MQIKINRKSVVTFSGNKITGNTYPVKDYIKSYLAGKWDSESKSWIVDANKVNDLIKRNAIVVVDEPATAKSAQHSDRWVNRDGSLAEDY